MNALFFCFYVRVIEKITHFVCFWTFAAADTVLLFFVVGLRRE